VERLAIYGLSDLHLSFNKPVGLYNIDPAHDIDKPMEKFGWLQHYDRIRDHWQELVTSADTVLIPGDISWALKLTQAKYDFAWIEQLPGNKVLSPGNHCYYAQSKTKVREALPLGMSWIDADFICVEDVVVVATRGWNLPGDPYFQVDRDRKIYERQVGRLKIALEEATQAYPTHPKIVMLHYPPVTKKVDTSGFLELMQQYEVILCVYGHLHGAAAHDAIEGDVGGVMLRLVACDALRFRPLPLSPLLR
jgi:uncharacterized protein